ncbi:MAG: hypothetical protein ACO1OO_04870 [Flavisolibacter sp.]
MEHRSENKIKRRKRIVRKGEPVLVRSVKAGQTSALCWERETPQLPRIWRYDAPAA